MYVRPQAIRDAIILDLKFDRPTRIQRYALPIILKGENVIAQAQTSAGKTVAFVIGMLNRIDTSLPLLQAICLTPTRELANQIVSDAVTPLSKHIPNIRIELAVKGLPPVQQSSQAHLIVGTPGTIASWIDRRYLNLSKVKVFVVDEADEMVSLKNKQLGKATLDIRNMLPPSCQVLLFSATYTTDILDYARRIVPRAYVITLTSESKSTGGGNTKVLLKSATPLGGGRGGGGRDGGRGGGRGQGRDGSGVGDMVGAESLVLDVIKQVILISPYLISIILIEFIFHPHILVNLNS